MDANKPNPKVDEIKVKLKDGEVTLRKPKAKAMRKALAESEVGNGQFKVSVLLDTLLPYCIGSHPWGTVPIKQAIDNLDGEDYLKLFNKLKDFVQFKGDVKGE